MRGTKVERYRILLQWITFILQKSSALCSLLARTTSRLRLVWFSYTFQNQLKKRLGLKSNLFFLTWAGVDSNHRTLSGTDLQSVAFSHSATYPYSILKICPWRDLNSWPLPYQGSALPLRHKGLMPQGLIKKAGNRNRTYNLRFTKPLLYRWAIPATELMILETNFLVNIFI